MTISTTPGVNTRQVLPAGLSIQVSQTWKNYSWNHASTIGEGDPTLNGLLKVKPVQSSLPILAHPKMKEIGDPSVEEAKAISQNYANLPALLAGSGFIILDDRREAFIKRAGEAKAVLAKTYSGKSIPASEMKRYDDLVNQLQFKAVEIVVRGFSVSKDNPKGSRQRKSDGLYVTERVLRRVTIDKPLSDVQLQQLLDQVTGALIKTMTRAAEYSVSYQGKDRNGNNVINISLTSVAKSQAGKPAQNVQSSSAVNKSAAFGSTPRT